MRPRVPVVVTEIGMPLSQARSVIVPLSEERRRFQRVRVTVLGRYMLPDRREFPCQIIDMSAGGIALTVPVVADIGNRVIAYIDQIGRVEGAVTRHIPNGFAMTLVATGRKRDILAAQLTWLANCQILDLSQNRQHDRVMPDEPGARLTLPDGLSVIVQVADISQSGAAFKTEHRPPIAAPITIGNAPARIVRHLDDGFAVEFLRLQHPDFIEENVTAGHRSPC